MDSHLIAPTTNDLQSASINTPQFSLKGLSVTARVVDVHDGDTVTVVFVFNGKLCKFQIRLAGIDSCEMTSKNERAKALSIAARNRVIHLITLGDSCTIPLTNRKCIHIALAQKQYTVHLKCFDFDKWGRVLGNIYLCETSTKSISDTLLDEFLAYPYNGATKMTEEEQVNYLTNRAHVRKENTPHIL